MKSFLVFLLTGLVCATSAQAAGRQDMKILQSTVRDWLDQSLANSPGTASYQVGALDPNLHLPACRDMQVSLPSGYRLLGRTQVRVQCAAGATWAVSVPVQVSILVTYFVAARPLAANQKSAQGPDGTRRRSGQSARLSRTGRAANRFIALNSLVAAGNPVRQEMLRSPIVIRQDQKVRILFPLRRDRDLQRSTALNNTQEGQPVRVKVNNGQTIQGGT